MHKCNQFWFDTLEIWKLQVDKSSLLFFNCMVVDELHELPVCQKHWHKDWDFWIGLKTGLKNRVPKHVAESLCVGLDGIGTSVGDPPNRFCARDGLTIKHHLAKKDKQRNRTRLSTVRNLVHIHESKLAADSKMKVCLGPSSASTAIWWCHTVRTQVGLLEPFPSLTSPKHTQFMEGVDLLRNSSFGSEAAAHFILPGSTCRKCLTAPTLPSRAAWWMSLPRDEPNPLGAAEGARLVNRDNYPDRYAIQDGKVWNKETIMKPPALHGFVLFPACGWGWQSRSRGARFSMHTTLEKKCYGK